MKFLGNMIAVLVGWFLIGELVQGHWDALLIHYIAFSLAFLYALLMWGMDKISTRKNK